MKRIFLIVMVVLLVALCGCVAKPVDTTKPAEETYPTRTVSLVCGSDAGAESDAWARITAKVLKKYLGVDVIVVNISGGSSTVALGQVIYNTLPNGYTVIMTIATQAAALARGMETPDLRTEVEHLGAMLYGSYVLGARADSKYKTFQDFIDDCKARPGEVKVATASVAGGYSCCCHLLRAEGLDFEVVPFGSTAPAFVELLGGRIDLAVADFSTFAPYIAPEVELDMRLQLLGFFSEERHPLAPEVPTVPELGYDVVWENFEGFGVRKDTPKYIIEILKTAYYDTTHDPEYLKLCADMGKVGLQFLTPEETVKAASKHYDKIYALKEAGIFD